MKLRRCVICARLLFDHTPRRMAILGYRMHIFDPGERRSLERRKEAA